ncbi:unnamed protein product [Vitrella brassicaformis CCMP3155]|uniref:Uncharacterized protein n=1 Tax=Vitrella brassicaformis (strain CCMP3155) TaxID=1169540 RepID=A0A0G4ET25_VITBC|nr:unnamed protein product [Vitrella brassicaformis CCMP3155]|eukprot:CEM00978.1 unnamed protein product [Vitrella brassicaformis CCMP3155]
MLEMGGCGAASQQVYKVPTHQWRATPFWPPTALIAKHGHPHHGQPSSRLHFSWNGATTVRFWRVMVAKKRAQSAWRKFWEGPKHQFEQWVDVPETSGACAFYRVEALDGKRRVLGVSKQVATEGCRK